MPPIPPVDLTRYGVEPNPGPCKFVTGGVPCPCQLTPDQLLRATSLLSADGRTCTLQECGHDIARHLNEHTPQGDASVGSWWRGLLTAEYHPPAPNAKLGRVELAPSSVRWFNTRSNRLLVRSCWADMWTRIDSKRRTYLRQVKGPYCADRPWMIIHGVPGIGTSCHGEYIIYQLLQQWNRAREEYLNVAAPAAATTDAVPPTVTSSQPPAAAAALSATSSDPSQPPAPLHIIYQTTQPCTREVNMIYHLSARVCEVADAQRKVGDPILVARESEMMEPFEQLLKQTSTIIIADGSASLRSYDAFVIWCLSARSACYKPPHPPLIEPTWSYEEMEELRAANFAHVLSAEFVRELFDKWGGVPLHVLSLPSFHYSNRHLNDPSRYPLPARATGIESNDYRPLNGAILSTNIDKLTEWIREIRFNAKKIVDDDRFHLLHIEPLRAIGTDKVVSFDYESVRVTFASTWIADECARHYLTDWSTDNRSKFESFLDGRNGEEFQSFIGDVRRYLWQGVLHYFLRQFPPIQFERKRIHPVTQGGGTHCGSESIVFPYSPSPPPDADTHGTTHTHTVGSAISSSQVDTAHTHTDSSLPSSVCRGNEINTALRRREAAFYRNDGLKSTGDFQLMRSIKNNTGDPSIESFISFPMTSSSSLATSIFHVPNLPYSMSSLDRQCRTKLDQPPTMRLTRSALNMMTAMGRTQQPGTAHTFHIYSCVPEHYFDEWTGQPYTVVQDVKEDADGSTATPAVPAIPIRVIQYQLRIPISIESAMKATESDGEEEQEEEEEDEETNESGEQAHKGHTADPVHAADIGVSNAAGAAAAAAAANVSDSSIHDGASSESMPHVAPVCSSSSPHLNPSDQSAPSVKKRKAADQQIDGDINGADDENHLSHKAARVEHE